LLLGVVPALALAPAVAPPARAALGPPSVSLTKVVDPGSATGWSFEFTISPATGVTPSAAQTVTSAAPTVTWDDLTPGTAYTITETGVAAGFQAGTISCDGGGNTFTPVADQVITCTATNQQLAQVTVVKSAGPANDEPFNFGFRTGTGPFTVFQLQDPTGPTRVFADLVPGQTHTIEEVLTIPQVSATWSVASVGCLDALDGTITAGTISGPVGEVSVTTKPGSRITCVFSNAQGTSITIQKVAAPAVTPRTFPFTVTGPAGAGLPTMPFLLDVNGDPTYPSAETFANLPSGAYTVSEATPSGWALVGFACTLQGAPFGTKDPATGTVSFVLDAGQDVVCTYQNTKLGSITIGKTTLPAGGTGFDFTTAGLTPASFTLAGGGSQPFTGLLPGTYTVTEAPRPGWQLTDLVCAGATASTVVTDEPTGTISVDLVDGEDISCTYSNTELASVTVAKVGLPATSTQQFLFSVAGVGPGLPDSSLVLTSGAERTYGGLLPQTVTVSETLPAGWRLTGGTCVSDDRGDLNLTGLQRSIPLLAGENVRCTYVNTALTSIVVVKQTEPAGSTQPFSFTASGGTPPIAPAAFTLVDNPRPTADFDPGFAQSFLVLPGTYTITELPTAGWTAATGEAGTLTCSPPVAGSVVTLAGSTATIAVQPGDRLVCEFLNKRLASPQPIAAPVVTGFSPGSGRVGSTVTIMGTSFSYANRVTFNGVPAAFSVRSPSLIVATVPVGARTGPVRVTTPFGSGQSTRSFYVLP
jgi:hypothetical protein